MIQTRATSGTVTLSPTPVLETARLILRAPQAGDWPLWRDFMQSGRSEFVRLTEMTDAMAWRSFGHLIGHWVLRGWGAFVVTRKGSNVPLASVGPWFPAGQPERELGWMIWDATAEGQGIAQEAVLAARAHAFGALGWDTAVSYIDPANTRSRALAQRLGCTLERDAPYPGDTPVQVWRHPDGDAQ